jgi:type I restriction enzyme, R subunit
MPGPTEYKTVQARILAYAQQIGWAYVPRDEAERRRGFAPHPGPLPDDGAKGSAERAQKASLFFGDLLHSQVRLFNPKYKEAEGALVGEFQRLHSDIYGNRDFLTALRTFIRRLRALGFDGPYSGTRHQFVILASIGLRFLRIVNFLFLNFA